jgi:ribonuclease VapC
VSGVVIDTSAAVAILLSEPARDPLLAALDVADPRLLSAASLVELTMVLEARLGPAGAGVADRFVRDGGVDVVPFDGPQASRAQEGWRRYGEGRHPAALNLGDCFTYGLAITTDQPVLCVGDDFPQTDAAVVAI